jgi:hypothetical protein
VNQEEFGEVVDGFIHLSSTVAAFPLHVIREGFRQNAIEGPDPRHRELMIQALLVLEECQEKMQAIKAEMQHLYGDSPPGVFTGPSAVGTARKERVDASGLTILDGGKDDDEPGPPAA